MVKNHLKRLTAPNNWKIERKKNKFVTKPSPGAHPLSMGVSLSVLIRDYLKKSKTVKEVKNVLNMTDILVDQKRRKETSFVVGFMDVISFSKTKEHYRLSIDKSGYLLPLKIEESEKAVKLAQVINKVSTKGKIQIILTGGRSILLDNKEAEKIKTYDTLLITLPDQKIKELLAFKPEMLAILTKGKHAGDIGIIKEISKKDIKFQTLDGKEYETLKKYAFVIGDKKPVLKLN